MVWKSSNHIVRNRYESSKHKKCLSDSSIDKCYVSSPAYAALHKIFYFCIGFAETVIFSHFDVTRNFLEHETKLTSHNTMQICIRSVCLFLFTNIPANASGFQDFIINKLSVFKYLGIRKRMVCRMSV